MTVLGPADETPSKQEILQRYEGAVKQVIDASTDRQYDYERQIQINSARRNWQFVKGQHYGVPGIIPTPFGDTTDFVSYDFASGRDATEPGGADIRLCPPVNVIGGDCYKFCAVMGQTAPRVKAVPDNANSPEDIQAAYNADVNARDLWVKCNVDRMWKSIAFHLYTTGPAFLRGCWNTDGKKYGQSSEPKIEVQMNDEGLPVPTETGTQVYNNGDAEMSIHSVLEVSVPWEAEDIEGNPLRLERMASKWWLLDHYSEKTDKLNEYRDKEVPDDEMPASATTAQEAREAVSTPSGTGRSMKPNAWRWTEYWLPTHLFQAINDANIRGIFGEMFPDGLYVAKVGSVIVELDNRCVTEEWAVCRVGRGPKINDRPIAADAIPLSRAIDDIFGLTLETILRAIPQTIMDSQLIDREAMNTKEAVPAEVILTALPVDGDLSKRIFQIPAARLSDQAAPMFEKTIEVMRDITGIRPELAGGGVPTNTYREAKQRRDQALLQLAPQAEEMRFASAEIATILIKLRAKYGAGTVSAQNETAFGTETNVVDLADLKTAGWHVEADDSFPMTLADTRDGLMSLLKESPPEVQQALSVLDPMNIEQVFELLQLPGFESSVKDQKKKTLKDIQQLLNEQPTEAPPPPPSEPGQGLPGHPPAPPPGPQPSQPPDPYDVHPIVAGILSSWLRSETGQQAKQQNPPGYQNVVARWQAEQQLANPTPPPPPMVKPTVSFAGKLEDFPNLVPELLGAAGVPTSPDATAPPPGPNPQPLGVPAPVGGGGGGAPRGSPEPEQSPLPPFDTSPGAQASVQ